ncbi:hypothetical protein PQR11_19945 [Paraburkholderia strydomiana]|uniref:hypothetical protein n=1 Tax=Paraburkholderia strydomiana TaxID=1245417 RepID=UPI0038B6DBC9
MFEIWAVEADGNRVLVRNDVADRSLARALVSEGNNGAAIRGELHRYVAVPDPDAVDAESKGKERRYSNAKGATTKDSETSPYKGWCDRRGGACVRGEDATTEVQGRTIRRGL